MYVIFEGPVYLTMIKFYDEDCYISADGPPTTWHFISWTFYVTFVISNTQTYNPKLRASC